MAGSSGGHRVLVVDDAPEMRIVISRALAASGYQVDVAATLAEAQDLDPGSYGAVLVDANLGPDKGTDLVEALRSADPAAAGRCLVMTGGATDALPDGVARLAKPFQLGSLIAAVRVLTEPAADAGPHPAATDTAGLPDPAARPSDSAAGLQDRAARPPSPVSDRSAPGRNGPAPAPAPASAGHTATTRPQTWELLDLARQVRARERRELVDFLHDGPIQEFTAIALELQMMARSASSGPAGTCGEILQRLHAATGALRWLVDGQWPFLTPEVQLAGALQQRTAWLLAMPLTVDAQQQPAGPTAAEVPVIVDVVELMLLSLVAAGPPMRAEVTVRAQQRLILIELVLTAADQPLPTDPAASRLAAARLADALGATVDVSFGLLQWRVGIGLPRHPERGRHRSPDIAYINF